MKRFKIVKEIIENSKNLNLKEFSKYARDPLKKRSSFVESTIKSTICNDDLDKLLDVEGKNNLSAYIIIFDNHNKISFSYYLNDFKHTGWKIFVYKDYWKKYQQENNINCCFKIIDSRKFRGYLWANQKRIFKYISEYLKKNGFQIKNFENCKKTFYFYGDEWYANQFQIIKNIYENNKNMDAIQFRKLLFYDKFNCFNYMKEWHDYILKYCRKLYDLIYA